MARVTRKNQKIFASNASNNGVFGSLQENNPTTSNDPDTIQGRPAFLTGWDDATYSAELLPPLEEFQGLQYLFSRQLAYLFQEGIAEWDTSTAYYKGSLVKKISGTRIYLYMSIADNNSGNQVTDTTKWKLLYDSDFGYADVNLSNLTSTGKNIGNWSTNVTNCITEIPQDIKLELNSGTLTLKAGSKVYVPNGSGVFDVVTTSSDLTFTQSSSEGKNFLYVNSAGTGLSRHNNVGSGDTVPTGFTGTFYNTTTNKIQYYSSGTPSSTLYSLPIAVITIETQNTATVSSIDQVFNGIGYIGSTIFALPAVKGLIPNGRNADGTLKSNSFSISSVKTQTRADWGNGVRYIKVNGSAISAVVASNALYDEDSNYNIESGSTSNSVYAGVLITEDSETQAVVSMDTKPAFHAADFGDVAKLYDNNIFRRENTFAGAGRVYEERTTAGYAGLFSKHLLTAKGTAPTDSNNGAQFALQAGNSSDAAGRLASIDLVYRTDGMTSVSMRAFKPEFNSTTDAGISIYYPASGDPYTYAPTPSSATDSSTKIATTKWVAEHRCKTKATTTSSASVDAPAYVVENYKNGKDWYRVWSDGWIEQGGECGKYGDSSGEKTITFLKPFTDTNYSASKNYGVKASTPLQDNEGGFYTRTTTTMKTYVTSGDFASGEFSTWFACGY